MLFSDLLKSTVQYRFILFGKRMSEKFGMPSKQEDFLLFSMEKIILSWIVG